MTNPAGRCSGTTAWGLTTPSTASTRARREPNGGADWSVVPNKITLFRLPLEADFPDPEDLADEVRRTVVHELAHHAGIDDRRLHDLGAD